MSTALAGLPDDDYALLAASGLFDADFYRTQARLPPGVDALQHYLLAGWIGGLQPRPDFESELYSRSTRRPACRGRRCCAG